MDLEAARQSVVMDLRFEVREGIDVLFLFPPVEPSAFPVLLGR